MNEYETQLRSVRRGLVWMMASYVPLAVVVVCGVIVLGVGFKRVPGDFDMFLVACAGIGVVVCGLIHLWMQYLALTCCGQCPEEVIQRGKTWISASGMFYSIAVLTVFAVPFAAVFLMGSVLFWQCFLRELARGMKSGAWRLFVWGVILLSVVTGFSSSAYEYGFSEPDGFLFMGVIYAMFFGVYIYIGLHLCLLAWLWWQMGRFVRRENSSREPQRCGVTGWK